ncbi:hypothetical protein HELRODRAFT_164250 [Helobdella robusta]|uniref:Uncharacterized protein n=1 Tax=Helobdella robusta TaxID=6412 RepID=T1EV59_HELRO|nr:hypothetical protein HELRODRAFT_164250 [Helobdella robusta]ESN94413.1 hypothetical protein HELRODRAFT_164250 [Helobdella robusta]
MGLQEVSWHGTGELRVADFNILWSGPAEGHSRALWLKQDLPLDSISVLYGYNVTAATYAAEVSSKHFWSHSSCQSHEGSLPGFKSCHRPTATGLDSIARPFKTVINPISKVGPYPSSTTVLTRPGDLLMIA